MATYKVLQDIEAEDKLLGPLTLKQFIFTIIFIAIGFIEFKLATTTGLSVVRWPFVIALLPPMIIFGFLAAPISRDQPNDVWLLARVRFLVKPHVRVWNQDGISQLVSVTAPKRVEQVLTNGLDQTEVKSRLNALANTLDSRGWAVKNVDVNMFSQPNYLEAGNSADRLVAPGSVGGNTAAVTDIHAADDILDPRSNPTAQHLDQMVQASTAAHRQQVLQSVKTAHAKPTTPPADYWFMNQPSGPAAATPQVPGYTTFRKSTVVAPGADDVNDAATTEPTDEEKALLKKIEKDKESTLKAVNSHLKVIKPLDHPEEKKKEDLPKPHLDTPRLQDEQEYDYATTDEMVAEKNDSNTATTPSTTISNPAILNLANNDDLNVATIARQAQRISEADGEVVISLH